MQQDFYWEYIQETDEQIENFCLQAKKKVPDIFFLGPFDTEKAIRNILWQRLSIGGERDRYNEMRLAGMPSPAIWQELATPLFGPLSEAIQPVSSEFICNQEAMDYYSGLSNGHQGRMLFYCKNYRLFCYLKPILEYLDEPVLLLSDSELPYPIEVKGDITHIQISDFSYLYGYTQDFLLDHFGWTVYYTNCISALTDLFHPKAFFLIEGTHFESTLIGSVAKAKNIPTFCLQQGWPCILHTAFRRLNYDYYLTWGKKFNELWQLYNQHTEFIDTGYPYPVNPPDPHQGITFFLQVPVFLLDGTYFYNILKWLAECARKYPAEKFYVRYHPEYKLPDYFEEKLSVYPNLSFVTDLPLDEVFSKTRIGISAFSSTLMEGIAHHVIPLVIDQSSMPGYLPDVEKEGIGLYAGSIAEADAKLALLLTDSSLGERIRKQINRTQHRFFSGTGDETIQNILRLLAEKKVLHSVPS